MKTAILGALCLMASTVAASALPVARVGFAYNMDGSTQGFSPLDFGEVPHGETREGYIYVDVSDFGGTAPWANWAGDFPEYADAVAGRIDFGGSAILNRDVYGVDPESPFDITPAGANCPVLDNDVCWRVALKSGVSAVISEGGIWTATARYILTFADGSEIEAKRQDLEIGFEAVKYSPVPIPGTLALLATGLAGLGAIRRRRR